MTALLTSARKRAFDTVDPSRAATALEWLVDLTRLTGRKPFLPLRHAGDTEHSLYNASTLVALAELMRMKGSRQRGRLGKPLASDTVDTYVSTVKTLCEFMYESDIVLGMNVKTAPRASLQTRRTQKPPGTRTLKLGVRAVHLRSLALRFDRLSSQGIIDWAAALLAHNIVLRGAELGTVPGKPFDPQRDLAIGAIEFRAPCAASLFRHWLVVYTVPAKDTVSRRRACPMAVARRAVGARGSDPLCTYDALARLWWRRIGGGQPFPTDADGRPRDGWSRRGDDAAALHLPLFLAPDGRVWRTSTTRSLFRDLAAAAGLDPEPFGAKSGRIGGATDARERTGDASRDIVQRRGRWASDVAEVYQRELLAVQLDLSVSLGDAVGEDLEQLCAGWAQPAHR